MTPGLLFSSEDMRQLSITELVKWPLYTRFQLCYTALQTKNTRRRTSSINPATAENSDDFCQMWELSHGAAANQHRAVKKINRTQVGP